MDKTVCVTGDLALVRLLQLVSPALPVGAYAYSQGLEYAQHAGWVGDEQQVHQWLEGVLANSVACLDIPVLKRLYGAWQHDDTLQLAYWSAYLNANRESRELQQEDEHLGAALFRLLKQLDVPQAQQREKNIVPSFAAAFSLAAVAWAIPLYQTAQGYLWAWLENQVAAAIKLIPLGQTAGQRILTGISSDIPRLAQHALEIPEQDITSTVPRLAIASALHETQYSRLFRS